VKCLVCGENILDDQQHSTVKLKDDSIFYAHDKCIDAIRMFITMKKSLPDELGETCPDLIYALFLENWFSEERTLNDVVEKIKQIGYNYNLATLSNTLRGLTRKGILTRQGKPKSYTYIQKRPPQ
jgi:hypothetical protein